MTLRNSISLEARIVRTAVLALFMALTALMLAAPPAFGQDMVAITGVVAQATGQTTATATVGVENASNTTVYLRHGEGATPSSWSTTQQMTTSDASVTFNLTSLNGNTFYSVEASLDNTFPDMGTESGTFTTNPVVPGKPTNLTVSDYGHRSLTLSWAAPESDGGAEITGYRIQWKWNNAFTPARERTAGAGATSHRLHNANPPLTNGTEYIIQVAATNAVGTGEWSDTTMGTPRTTPTAPTLTGQPVAGDGTLTISWNAPSDDGGSDLTGYRVEWKLQTAPSNSDGSYPNGEDLPLTPQEYTIPMLINGSAYAVRVQAVNSEGGGSWSNGGGTPVADIGIDSVTTPASDLTATQAKVEVAVEGAEANQTVYIRYRPTSPQGSWEPRNNSVSASPETSETVSFDLTGLMKGTEYEVQASLASDFMPADEVVSHTFTTLVTKPGAPAITDVTHGDGTLTVTWTAPEDDGGATIDKYVVRWKPTTASNFAASDQDDATTGLTHTIQNLQNGTVYDVEVMAHNSAGNSDPAQRTATPSRKPDAPGNVTVTHGDRQLVVTWEQPDSGGATIEHYLVQWKSGAQEFHSSREKEIDGQTLTYTIPNLDNGTGYTVRVIAQNLNGNSDPATGSGTPSRRPDAPAITDVTHGDGSLTVEWNEPDNGGASIDKYVVQWKKETETSFAPADSADVTTGTSYTIQTLENGETYDMRVVAHNTNGNSLPDDEKGTPSTTPDPPESLTVSPTAIRELTVTWTAPGDDGGDDISGYRVEWKVNTETSWTGADLGASASSYEISGLTDTNEAGATAYSVRVQADNINGGGEWETADDTDLVVANVKSITFGEYDSSAMTVPAVVAVEGKGNFNPGPGIGTANKEHLVYIDFKEDSVSLWNSVPTNIVIDSEPNGHLPSANSGNTLNLTIEGLESDKVYQVRASYDKAFPEDWRTTNSEYAPGDPAVPSEPTDVSLTAGKGSLTVSWDSPNDMGGSIITRYRVDWKGPGQGYSETRSYLETDDDLRSYEIPNLTKGVLYTVRVRAGNSQGFGPGSEVSGSPGGTPDAPTDAEITVADEELTVGWGVPANDYGSAITGYTLEWVTAGQNFDGDQSSKSLTSVNRSFTIENLTNGTTYRVRVRASNEHGDGDWSGIVGARPGLAPGAVRNLNLRRGDHSLEVEYEVPLYDGIAPIQYYEVDWKLLRVTRWDLCSGTATVADGCYRSAQVTASPDPVYTITGLVNGIEYDVRVRAYNGGHYGEWSVKFKRPLGPPEAPTITSVEHGDELLTVTWEPPENDGGNDITGHQLQVSEDRNSFSDDTTEPVTDSPHTVDGLHNGTAYYVRLRADNQRGRGSLVGTLSGGRDAWNRAQQDTRPSRQRRCHPR